MELQSLQRLGWTVRSVHEQSNLRVIRYARVLFDEERAVKTRSWSENLTYLTGVGYLGGSIAGGGWGLYGSMKSARVFLRDIQVEVEQNAQRGESEG